jgi:hypothetical protein
MAFIGGLVSTPRSLAAGEVSHSMSESGSERQKSMSDFMSVIGGRADSLCSLGALSLMTDAVEKGLDLIVVPLDAVFDGRRFKVASALK